MAGSGKRICHICQAVFTPPGNYYGGYCDVHRDEFAFEEMGKVAIHLTRAMGYGTPATLTLIEWQNTLKDWNFACAYCGGPYEVLEHFYPIAKGGGTTKGNTVPACYMCNNHKERDNTRQDMLEAIARVDSYLSNKREHYDLPFVEYNDRLPGRVSSSGSIDEVTSQISEPASQEKPIYRELVGHYTNILFTVAEYDWFLLNPNKLWWSITDVSAHSGIDKSTLLEWFNQRYFPETRPIPGNTSRFAIEIARSSLIVAFGQQREQRLIEQSKDQS